MLKGEELYQLIPQRPPIVMVSEVRSVGEGCAQTGLQIEKDNIFVKDGKLQEAGIIEHIAQSAAAMEGYKSYVNHLPPKLGFIGEIKKCKIFFLPCVGTHLLTTLTVLGEAAGVTLVQAKVETEDSDKEPLVAECQMKIFIKNE